jgi:hypothetical protein
MKISDIKSKVIQDDYSIENSVRECEEFILGVNMAITAVKRLKAGEQDITTYLFACLEIAREAGCGSELISIGFGETIADLMMNGYDENKVYILEY